MKVLITTDLYTTNTNGVVTSIRNLADELRAMGHTVRILTFSETKESRRAKDVYYLPSVSLKRIYPNLRMPLKYTHPYLKELTMWKPDVIHSQCEFFSFQFAKRIAKRTGAPIVHTYHALYEQYVPYLFHSQSFGEYIVRVFSRERLKKVDRIIAPTAKVEAVLRGYGVRNPISVIPSGICLDQYKVHLSAEERSERRRQLGITDGQTVLLNLGRLAKEKNVEELLVLFSVARTEHPDLIFLIVGDGPDRSALEQLAQQLKIAEYVVFTGMVAPDKVQNYYQIADIFVSASTSETQGLTYVEAAANALPLLCRKDPCLRGVLVPGVNGFSYTNDGEFLHGLSKLVNDPQQCGLAGVQSQQIAKGYSCAFFAASVADVYRAVIADRVCDWI